MMPFDPRSLEVTVRRPDATTGPGFGLRPALALVTALVRRDLSLHYRHTRLGVLWGLAPPLLATGVFELFLGRTTGLGSATGGTPYPQFLFAGLVAWQFLARAASGGAGSVVGNAWIVSQIPFPRVVLPVSSVLTGLGDFALGSLAMLAWGLLAGPAPGLHLLWWPVAFLSMLLLGLAGAVLLAAAAVRIRDVVPATGYALQALLFASPVLYTLDAADARIPRAVLVANPASGVLETFRAAWFGSAPDLPALGVSLLVSTTLLAAGLLWLRRTQDRFADLA